MIHTFATFSLLGVLSLGGFSCSGNRSSQSNLDRIKDLMNHGRYFQAIGLLEREQQLDPKNQGIGLLLAEAHLGAAGFELFELASAVFGRQNSVRLNLIVEPDCSLDQISQVGGFDIRCLVYRVMKHIPDIESYHFVRAKELLRKYYPEPTQSPVDVNFLSALVELSSAIGRVRKMISIDLVNEVISRPGEDRPFVAFEIIAHQLKRFLDELIKGFKRATHSYQKVSNHLKTIDGRPIVKIGNNYLIFDENLDISRILYFFGSVVHEYGDDIDDELNELVSEEISKLGPGVLRFLRQMDLLTFRGEGSQMVRTWFDFSGHISSFLNQSAEEIHEDTQINLFEFVWSSPPQIFKNFSQSISESWDTEDATLLRKYFKDTEEQWKLLDLLSHQWTNWLEDSLDKSQRTAISDYFEFMKTIGEGIDLPPARRNSHELFLWQDRSVVKMSGHLNKIFKGEVEDIDLDPDQVREGRALLELTTYWISTNLWEVK